MTSPDTLAPLLAQLSFPLNAFACATWLEEGQVDYLHYGLFDAEHPDLAAAQGQSTRLILDRLPPPGTHILEVGIGLGTTAAKLIQLGYRVTGLAPDPAQVTLARQRAGAQAEFAAMRFEDFPMDSQRFDVILLQESAQYLEPTALFAAATARLTAGGEVLVLDQFALRRTVPQETHLHVGEEFVQQAARHRLGLIEHLDLSAQAGPTLDYILKILSAHDHALQQWLPQSGRELASLREAVSANRQRYRQGLLGYALYHFRLGT